MLPIMVSWSGAPTVPIISWNVLHQCGCCCPPPFVIICSSTATQYPTQPLTSSTLNVANYELQVQWKGLVPGRVNPPTLFNNSAPGSLPRPNPPSWPPQGLGLPLPTIWAARRPPQESPSCSRAPQHQPTNQPGFQNANHPHPICLIKLPRRIHNTQYSNIPT